MFTDLRNLPDPVLARLDAAGVDGPTPGVDLVTTYRGRDHRLEERRGPVEVRETDDGAPIFEGYASSTGVWYDVFGGPASGWGWREQIAPGAFAAALDRGDDTRLLVNHDGLPIARTQSGTLQLDEDSIGLHVVTPTGLDMANPTVQEVVSGMRRADVDQMSFAFTVDSDDDGMRLESWNEDYTERIIRQVRLYDVAVVTYPANPATAAQLRADFVLHEPRRGMPLVLARALVEAERLT